MSSQVTVFGSFVVDLMARTHRLPVPGETVKGHYFKQGAGGKGFNQGIAAKKAGGNVVMVTKLGKDTLAQVATDAMDAVGLPKNHLFYNDEISTGIALIMNSYDMISKLGWINLKQETARADKYSKSVNVKTPSLNQLVGNLSGGNQQKVVIGKLLCRQPDILIFDEPTVGVDVGAKQEIYKIMESLIAQGRGIILISSYLPEVMGLGDRLIVMSQGRITAEFDHEALQTLTEEDVLKKASFESR